MPLTVSQLQELVTLNLPAFVFAPDERFFPSNTATWITNSLAEPWTVPGSRLSGTAVMRVPAGEPTFPTGFGTPNVMAGSNFPGGARLQPDDFAGLHAPVEQSIRDGQDVFVNFGGWLSGDGSGAPDFAQGSADRIYPRFSDLANAMNAGNLVEADALQNPDVSRPNMTQPREVFIYAEVDWAGLYSGISDRQSEATNRDFGPDSPIRRALDQFIVVTYYLFYPMTEYPPDATARRAESAVRREGQWEAVSLYYRTRRDPTFRFPRPNGLPFVTFDDVLPSEMELTFLSYSRTARSDEAVRLADVRSVFSGGVEWARGGLENEGFGPAVYRPYTNPKVYVTSGTHKNLFNPAATASVEEGGPNGTLAAGGTIAGTIGGGLMAGCAFVVLCVLGIFFLLLSVILAALSVTEADDKTSYAPTGPDNDYVPPGGIAVGGVSWPVWVPARVQIFSQLAPADGEERDPVNSPPAWWDYSGRWGIRVARSASVRWDNGTRRIDAQGRSRAYWNTLALLRFLATHPDEAERVVGS